MKKTLILLSLIFAAISCTPKDVQTLSVVPYPNDVKIKAGTFDIIGAEVRYDAAADTRSKELFKAFARQLSVATGADYQVIEGTNGSGFSFIVDSGLPHEAYRLSVTKKGARIEASGLNGFNYAIQTIKQMLPAAVFGTEASPEEDWSLQCVKISDAPRFGYRGMHMDVSRHFFNIDEVKKYLDIMEIHKLNTLHWHLTDDQGWRLEIKKYPRLTEVGSIRNKTIVGHAYDGKGYDETPYGEGYWFSQEQVKEILEYAASKGITVIPEIDLPGHMLAALAAYPELGCTGGPYEVWGDWGISDDVLCVGKEETMQFLEDVLTEVCELFPAEYVHIGGDECPKVRWETCPRCQAKIEELGLKDDEHYKAEHYLQGYVTSRMEKFLTEKGKKLIGWDEILEGEIAPNATVMSWRGVAGGLQAVRMGHDAIMTPNTFYYLDYYQSLDKANEPLAIGGYLPIEKSYSYEPFTVDMTDEEKSHVLGVQANLWTEYIATADHLFYMLLPRMAALSEVQWCQPENKSWERFVDSADDFCAIYDVMGYRYGPHIFETKGFPTVNQEKKCLEVMLKAQGDNAIYYTLDGSEPTTESAVYTEPIEIRESCTLKAMNPRNTKVYERTFNDHKAMGKPVRTLTPTHPSYTFNCPDMLTDGILGGDGPYNSGFFAGWYRDQFEAVIDMDGCTYSEVTLSTLVFKYDYIFPPVDLVVLTSEDGKNFTEVTRAEYPLSGGYHDGNGRNNYTVTFPETSAKYLKVTAGTIEALPEWHNAKGRPGFLFVDEVIVK